MSGLQVVHSTNAVSPSIIVRPTFLQYDKALTQIRPHITEVEVSTRSKLEMSLFNKVGILWILNDR